MSNFAITNARVVLLDRIIPRSTIVVKGKKIVAIRKGKSAPPGVAKINARGNFVSPGFIDLHIHGEIETISRQQAQGGTTGFLATLHPAAKDVLLKDIAHSLACQRRACAAKMLGLRIEGPFLHRDFCGALAPQALRKPDLAEAKAIIKQARGNLKMIVLAPELKGAEQVIRLFKKHNVIPSIGHTGADFKQTKAGINAGATHATHTFNRMRSFDHHHPGALGAVLTDNRVDCEVIADGIHVHPGALKLLLSCKGLNKVILITDSTQAQKHPAKSRCGDVFRLKDGTLYGTALTLNKALKNVIKFLGLNLPEAVRLVTLNPAKALGIDRKKGSIAVGKDADIVIFDKDFNVKLTIVAGTIITNKPTNQQTN